MTTTHKIPLQSGEQLADQDSMPELEPVDGQEITRHQVKVSEEN